MWGKEDNLMRRGEANEEAGTALQSPRTDLGLCLSSVTCNSWINNLVTRYSMVSISNLSGHFCCHSLLWSYFPGLSGYISQCWSSLWLLASAISLIFRKTNQSVGLVFSLIWVVFKEDFTNCSQVECLAKLSWCSLSLQDIVPTFWRMRSPRVYHGHPQPLLLFKTEHWTALILWETGWQKLM